MAIRKSNLLICRRICLLCLPGCYIFSCAGGTATCCTSLPLGIGDNLPATQQHWLSPKPWHVPPSFHLAFPSPCLDTFHLSFFLTPFSACVPCVFLCLPLTFSLSTVPPCLSSLQLQTAARLGAQPSPRWLDALLSCFEGVNFMGPEFGGPEPLLNLLVSRGAGEGINFCGGKIRPEVLLKLLVSCCVRG